MGLTTSELQVQAFAVETVPLLARHYRREALNELESRSEWLKGFTSRQPDFEDARSRFFGNGSGCMHDLESHIELTRLARANEALTRHFGSVYSLVLAGLHTSLFTSGFEKEETSTLVREEAEIEEIRNRMIEVERVEHPDSTDSLLGFLVAGQATITSSRENARLPMMPFDLNKMYRSMIPLLNKYKEINTTGTDCYIILKEMNEQYDCATAGDSPQYEALKAYYGNIKNFTYKLGCPEAHDDPLRNIAEMRKFHATQMPFFQKLQDELQDQIKKNNEQQEIITALVFRHLLEHLPPDQTRTGDRNAGPRWQEFWDEASRKELGNMVKRNTADHPMRGLMVNDAIDKGTNQFKDGPKGHLLRTGKILFSTLSDNIHNYKGGKSKGYDVVRSDQWGLSVRKILTTLIPTEFNAEGEVEWDRERQRYL